MPPTRSKPSDVKRGHRRRAESDTPNPLRDRDKHFDASGRKQRDLEYVGAKSPDTDPPEGATSSDDDSGDTDTP